MGQTHNNSPNQFGNNNASKTLFAKQSKLETESAFLKKEELGKKEVERMKVGIEEALEKAVKDFEEEKLKKKKSWIAAEERKVIRILLKIGVAIAMEVPAHYIVIRLIG